MSLRKTIELMQIRHRNDMDPDSDIVNVYDIGDMIHAYGQDGDIDLDLLSVMRYRSVKSVIPLRKDIPFLTKKEEIDPQVYQGFVQLESGLCIPGYIAAKISMDAKPYEPGKTLYHGIMDIGQSIGQERKPTGNIIKLF